LFLSFASASAVSTSFFHAFGIFIPFAATMARRHGARQAENLKRFMRRGLFVFHHAEYHLNVSPESALQLTRWTRSSGCSGRENQGRLSTAEASSRDRECLSEAHPEQHNDHLMNVKSQS
jgi:hypothetical protein